MDVLIVSDSTAIRKILKRVISRKHGGTAELDNLAFACYLCKR